MRGAAAAGVALAATLSSCAVSLPGRPHPSPAPSGTASPSSTSSPTTPTERRQAVAALRAAVERLTRSDSGRFSGRVRDAVQEKATVLSWTGSYRISDRTVRVAVVIRAPGERPFRASYTGVGARQWLLLRPHRCWVRLNSQEGLAVSQSLGIIDEDGQTPAVGVARTAQGDHFGRATSPGLSPPSAGRQVVVGLVPAREVVLSLGGDLTTFVYGSASRATVGTTFELENGRLTRWRATGLDLAGALEGAGQRLPPQLENAVGLRESLYTFRDTGAPVRIRAPAAAQVCTPGTTLKDPNAAFR